MSKTTILSIAATLALAVNSLTAAPDYQACEKGWKSHPIKKVLSTTEDLKKAAKSYEEAYQAYVSQESGKAAMESKKSLKEILNNSSVSNKEIYKAVKRTLLPQLKKSETDTDAVHAQRKLAYKEVMHQVERLCEKRVKLEKAPSDLNPVTQAAMAYFEKMITVAQTCPEAYQKLKLARFGYAIVLKSLLKQGMTSESLRKELEAAGITNSYLLNKPEYLTKKAA